MTRIVALLCLAFAALAGSSAHAEPADVDAAARGVVRVIIVGAERGADGERRLYPISHGTGFAVSPWRIVTNAHVVRDAVNERSLGIAIIPSEGEQVTRARVLSISPRNDLALLELTGDLRLPPLTLASGASGDDEVSAVGYPMNVDRAQGLASRDIFRPQPPVKSRGFLSGERPSRQFDTLLHTAPIARGNSGGPLLDECGRVLGVNSFGADAQGADAEFYFAVSNRELVPFLRANEVEPRINRQPCRTLAELDAAERERAEREQARATNGRGAWPSWRCWRSGRMPCSWPSCWCS